MLPSSDLFLQLCFLNRVVSGLYKPVLSCTVLRLFKFVCSLVLTVSPWRRNSPQRGGLDYPLFQLHTLVTSDQLLSVKSDMRKSALEGWRCLQGRVCYYPPNLSCCCDKMSQKRDLRKKGLLWFIAGGFSPSMAGKSGGRSLRWLTASTIRKQRLQMLQLSLQAPFHSIFDLSP